MSKYLEIAVIGLVAAWAGSAYAQGGDPVAGEKVFAKCKACHAVGEGAKNKVGPELNGLIGRPTATVEGFKYSPAMQKAGKDGLVWSNENLTKYLADPKAFVKGTKMAFAGLKQQQDIDNVVAYLATFSAPGADKAEAKPEPAKETADVAAAPAAKPAAEPAAAVETAAATIGEGAVFKLGRAAAADEIAAWDIDVRPDGVGLPPGKGTVAQGEVLYTENCAVCHGDFGEAVGRWPVLAGGHGTLSNERPEKTIGSFWPYPSTVYDYIRRAMPFGNPRTLSNDDIYALTAYVLFLNDVVTDEDFELSDKNFSTIKLSNEANFFDDDRLSEPHYANKKEACMKDCLPGVAAISQHAAVLDVTPEDAGEDDAGAGTIE